MRPGLRSEVSVVLVVSGPILPSCALDVPSEAERLVLRPGLARIELEGRTSGAIQRVSGRAAPMERWYDGRPGVYGSWRGDRIGLVGAADVRAVPINNGIVVSVNVTLISVNDGALAVCGPIDQQACPLRRTAHRGCNRDSWACGGDH